MTIEGSPESKGGAVLKAALAFACSRATVTTANTQSDYGTDTRALTFIDRFQNHGGYLNDAEEYLREGNGELTSRISGVDTGELSGSRASYPIDAEYFASASLYTGELKAFAQGVSICEEQASGTRSIYQTFARSNASLKETLFFRFDPSLAGTYQPIGLRVRLDSDYIASFEQNSGTIGVRLSANIMSDTANFARGSDATFHYGTGRRDAHSGDLVDYRDGLLGFDIMVPAQDLTLDLVNGLSVNGYGAIMDASHTSSFSFVLAEGASFTSASGVFLTGGVLSAEPDTWTTMTACFGAGGGASRRLRPSRPTALAA